MSHIPEIISDMAAVLLIVYLYLILLLGYCRALVWILRWRRKRRRLTPEQKAYIKKLVDDDVEKCAGCIGIPITKPGKKTIEAMKEVM